MKENQYLLSYGAYREFQGIVDRAVNDEDIGLLAEMLTSAVGSRWNAVHRDDGLVVVEFK